MKESAGDRGQWQVRQALSKQKGEWKGEEAGGGRDVCLAQAESIFAPFQRSGARVP